MARKLNGRLGKWLGKAAEFHVDLLLERSSSRGEVDIAVAEALRMLSGRQEVRFPLEIARFLRAMLDVSRLSHKLVKAEDEESPATRRFKAFLNVLSGGQPTMSMGAALELAAMGDRYLADFSPMPEWRTQYLDVGDHFARSTSFSTKGRLIWNLIRYCRPTDALELGTAYGVSAMIILEAQKTCGLAPKLATLEAFEPQRTLSTALLQGRYGEDVTLLHGRKVEELPRVAASGRQFGFFFHDAGHVGDDYIGDFKMLLPVLAPGAIVMMDDIKWDANPKSKVIHASSLTCYQGWRQVVAHERVQAAAEIASRGIALLR